MTSNLLLVQVLVFTVVSALRHFEDDLSGASKVLFDSDWPGLDIEEPLSPRRPMERSEPVPLGPPASSVLDIKPRKCGRGRYKFESTGELLGQGAYGKVYKVLTTSKLFAAFQGGKYFALKVPNDLHGESAAEHEIKIMRATSKHDCRHVLPLIEEEPCVDGKAQRRGILTRLAKFELGKWRRTAGSVPAECGSDDVRHQHVNAGVLQIYEAVEEGLKCMHEAGYAHGDIKGPNILFEDLDEKRCPTGIKLADFGLTYALGTFQGKFGSDSYYGSWYLPGSIFEGAPDPLNLSQIMIQNGVKHEVYKVDTRLDDCAFAMMMWNLFGVGLPRVQERVGKGACGPMGPDRARLFP